MLRRSYDRSAAGYNSEFRALQQVKYRAMLGEKGEWLKRSGVCGRVLDLGCGTGLLAEFLANPGSRNPEIVGLDFSHAMLNRARGKRLSLVQASIEALPFGDEEFEAVMAFTVLRILSDRAADRHALGEVARVLAPGGYLVVTVLKRSDDGSLARDLEAVGLQPGPAHHCGQDVGYICLRS